MRRSGILCPVSSLPSSGGIGCFSKEAYEFVDFLKASNQSLWQVLPLSPTGFGDSPYQSFSSFAGNPYFISLEELEKEGLLRLEDYAGIDFGSDPARVDYGKLYENRFRVLRTAYEAFKGKADPAYESFLKENEGWLTDYTLFMAIKNSQGGAAWQTWEKGLADRRSGACKKAESELADEMGFYAFQQYEFLKQWEKLKAYANASGIEIVGDIPIYVAPDSADAWANPDIFLFDEDNLPTAVAGCPPDLFSVTGQLWGNPLYDWEAMKKDNYSWWTARLLYSFKIYDLVKIDHFRGFESFYAVPYGHKTAEHGEWLPGPGLALFEAVEKAYGKKLPLLAEDLGLITPEVRKLLKDTGIPGMKVLQFAFSGDNKNVYLPFHAEKHAVIYTGTHDNETTRSWIENASDKERDQARRVINSIFTDYGAFTWDMIRAAQGSVCDTCIIPIQDYLVKDNSARMNTPSVAWGNWQWRMKPHEISWELTEAIAQIVETYGRMPEEEEV